MGEITIAASEREALRALDTDRLATLIDKAVSEERSGELHLSCCRSKSMGLR